MPYVPQTDLEKIRAHFSLAPLVKKLVPGKEAREKLCWDLSLYYEDALFATYEEPVVIELDTFTLNLFPTSKDPNKIRVMVKE